MSIGLKYDFSHRDGGLIVNWVDPRGPAYEASIRQGDMILSVDGMSTHEGDVLAFLDNKVGESIHLVVRPRPRPDQLEQALGSPLMGGILYPQPLREVTLEFRQLPEQSFFDHLRNIFTSPAVPELFEAQNQLGDRRTGPGQAFFGVGICIRVDGGITTVTSLFAEGSAARSGRVRTGDELTAIDGMDIAGLQVDTITSLLLGPADSQVSLTFRRTAANLGWDTVVVVLQRSTRVSEYSQSGIVVHNQGHDSQLKPGWLGKELGRFW